MKKICKAVAFLIILCMMLSASVSAFAASDLTSLVAQQLAGQDDDITELITAVQQKDTDTLVDALMLWLGDYFRQNGLKDDFGYFNADNYLTAYQDVNTECNADRTQALEHYIVSGAKEGRISGGKYDLPLAVRIDPSFLLNTDILNTLGDPEAFLEAAAKPVEQITKGFFGGSGGGSNPTPSGPSSYTLVFYGSNQDWNLPPEILKGILEMYGTNNINFIIALGGSYTWSNAYLQNLLGRSEGSTGAEKNKTGYFVVNVSELNSALDQVSAETGIPVLDLNTLIWKGTDEGNALYNKVSSVVFSEKVLPLIEGTSVSSDAPLGSQKTLETVLELAKTNYTADSYALTFSGHGGGPRGCLYSDDNTACVNSSMIDAALSAAGFGEQNRMSLIAFDACSMGCVETAAVLGQYCEYMYGSEALQLGSLDMNVWISAVKNNLQSNVFSKAVAYAVYEMRASISDANCISTAALSNCVQAQELLNAIDQWSVAMLAGMRDEDTDTAMKYFNALRKASVFCYQVSPATNVVDIKDLMQELKIFLNEQGIDTMDATINAVLTAVDAWIEHNSVSIDAKLLYDSMKGGVIESNAEYRDEHLKYDLCGFSIIFPDYLLTRLSGAPVDKKERIEYINQIRDKFTKEYLTRFEKLGLQKYTEVINEYLNYFFTPAEAERIKQLSKEMTSCSSKDGAVAGYKDIASVSFNADKTYVQVDITGYQAGQILSNSSSGDALIDIVETATYFSAYLTSKFEITLKNGTSNNVDLLFSNNGIPYSSIKGYQSRIELLLNEFLYDGKTTISYAEKEGVVWEDTEYLDLLMVALASNADDAKENMVKAGVPEFSNLINIREAARKDSQDHPEDEEKKQAFEKAEEDCRKFLNDCFVYYGECNASDSTTKDAYLITKKNSDGNYVYCDAVKENDSGDNFVHIEGVESIRFYHYVLQNEYSGNKDTGVDLITAIEKRDDYKGSYYDIEKYVYDVTDTQKKVVIHTIEMSTFLNPEKYHISADSMGYYMTLINPDGQLVALNSDINGKNASLSDENYTTPLTWGQLRQILSAQSPEQSEDPKAADESEETEEFIEIEETEELQEESIEIEETDELQEESIEKEETKELQEESVSEAENSSIAAEQETQTDGMKDLEHSEQGSDSEQLTVSGCTESEEQEQTELLEENKPSSETEIELAA